MAKLEMTGNQRLKNHKRVFYQLKWFMHVTKYNRCSNKWEDTLKKLFSYTENQYQKKKRKFTFG